MSPQAAPPMQSDEAVTIFQKGAHGRRAFLCPEAGVPQRDRLSAVAGVELLHEQPVVREFAVTLDVADTAAVRRVIARCQDAGINPGYALGRDYDEHPTGLLVAITEQRTAAHIDRLAPVLGEALAAERAAAPAREEVRA